jgi:hypothetical protein
MYWIYYDWLVTSPIIVCEKVIIYILGKSIATTQLVRALAARRRDELATFSPKWANENQFIATNGQSYSATNCLFDSFVQELSMICSWYMVVSRDLRMWRRKSTKEVNNAYRMVCGLILFETHHFFTALFKMAMSLWKCDRWLLADKQQG